MLHELSVHCICQVEGCVINLWLVHVMKQQPTLSFFAPFAQGEPLRRYFHGLYSQAELNAFEANMYLAEDRVLCLEIVAKKGGAYRCGALGNLGFLALAAGWTRTGCGWTKG